MEALKLDHGHLNEKCIICEEEKSSGIYICNQLICESCQTKIVNTDVDDSDYMMLVRKLGKLSLTINEKVTESSS